MIIIPVPYERIERLFGTFVADHFSEISFSLLCLGFILWMVFRRKRTQIRPTEETEADFYEKWEQEKEDLVPVFQSKHGAWSPSGWIYDSETGDFTIPDYDDPDDTYQAEHGEKSPTGWVYDRDIRKWVPPQSLVEESRRRWKWNPEKGIWIDLDKEERLKRYREYQKTKPPGYEEWKAQRLKEMEAEKNNEGERNNK